MRILLTGISGFAGSHLASYILKLPEHHEVIGLIRWRSPRDNIKNLLSHPRLTLVEGDLLDQGSLIRILNEHQPDAIWHGAAQSYVQSSFQNPIQTFQHNIIGTANLLEALRIVNYKNICVLVSSSEVYGQPKQHEVPMTEENPLRPTSPYAVSKAACDLMGRQYYENFGLKIIRTRLFSHEGIKRGSVFCQSSIAKQLVTPMGNRSTYDPEVREGNLDSVRTWAHIDDAVHAYWLTFLCPPGEVYNIGGKETTTVREALDRMIQKAKEKYGIEQVHIIQDSSLMRPTDITLQIPNYQKFVQQTGWQPQKGLQEIIDDLLEYWHDQL
ncbi:MAG: GDP-mannose 4,6-dehydratase [Nanoarchaeota archaeon]